MDEREYKERLAIIVTATPPKQFEFFIKKGVAEAKKIIISSLKKNTRGLEYGDLKSLVEKGLKDTSINSWNNAWKIDAFMLALAGLEIEDKKIKRIKGIFSLKKGHPR